MSASPASILTAIIVVFYIVLGFLILAPEAVYSGDIGVKYVQARALTDHHFTRLDIPYPGEFLDPSRALFPMRPPFVMITGTSAQAIFSPISAVVQAVGVAIAGFRGLILISLIAGAAILACIRSLAPSNCAAAAVIAAGLGSPLWFYAVSGWEHAPAIALSTAAFVCSLMLRMRQMPLVAGLLLGAGATLRDETLLMLPGLLVAIWLRRRTIRPLTYAAAGVLIPLAIAAAIEVWWFQRPAAAHPRHAVHLVQSALHVTNQPHPDVPSLEPFTPRQRYETVVQYWLLGYGQDRWIFAFAAGLIAALLARWKWGSSAGILAWLIAVVGLASVDLWGVLTAPKWLAGLHRVSPYLVFALLPLPPNTSSVPVRTVAGLATVVYLIVALAGVDTTGGKSLGPRLLLPLLPLLSVASIVTIAAFLRGVWVDRWVGRMGVVLVAIAIVIHLCGTIRAYYERNKDDASSVLAVSGSPERFIIADDPFTAQLFFPLYYRKIILLADSPELARKVGTLAAEHRIPAAVLVSRLPQPAVTLAPLRLALIERRGRMLIQYWRQ